MAKTLLSLEYLIVGFACVILSTIIAQELNTTKDVCVFIDYYGKKINISEIECSKNRICQKNFKISNIHHPPYNSDNNFHSRNVQDVLKKCCGKCVQFQIVHNLRNVTQVTQTHLEGSDIVYPLLASTATSTLYGFYFLPYEDPSVALYVTKTKDEDFLKPIFALYPLIVTSLLLAVISGFIGWIIDTWYNKEEFPRGFLIGWFEGFWWAFISMTTVGYGDKCPKSVPAKLFSVVWILIGIIACGMITGEITGQVVKANSPPPASMKGAKVGALQFRSYDVFVIAQHGGIVMLNDEPTVTDFKSDVLMLITKLRADEIDGFVLDRQTLMYVTDALETIAEQNSDNKILKDKIDFFIKKTTRIEKSYQGERFSYGMLIKDVEDYEYFKDYIRNSRVNHMVMELMDWADFEQHGKEDKISRLYSADYSFLFSPSSNFKHTMVAIAVMIGFIMLFGISYEIARYCRKTGKYSGESNVA